METVARGPSSTRKVNAVGFALIILAFALHFIAAAAGIETAYEVGQRMVYTLLALVMLVAVVGFVVRKKDAMAKAWGRVVAGALLVLFVGVAIAQTASEKRAIQQFVRDTITFRDKQLAPFVDLTKRFDAFRLDSILTPDTLTTAQGQATAKAAIVQYRALLAERRALLQRFFAETERFINTAPTPETRTEALKTMAANREATDKVYEDVDQAQTRFIDSIAAVQEWSTMQTGRLQMSGGQLLFASEAQRAELVALLAKVTAAEKHAGAVQAAALAAQATARTQNEENTRQANQVLSQ